MNDRNNQRRHAQLLALVHEALWLADELELSAVGIALDTARHKIRDCACPLPSRAFPAWPTLDVRPERH